jgi:hypothetical protein
MSQPEGGRVKIREGETQEQAVSRFTEEVQKRLDGRPYTPLEDPEEEAGVQDFINAAVKGVQDEIDGMKF